MHNATKKAFLRLKELRDQVQRSVYERISLAQQIMTDHDWIIEIHCGDDVRAREAVQNEYFPDLCKLISLETLLNILKEFPTEEEWKENHYDLGLMKALYEERHKVEKPKQTRESVTLQEYRDALDRIQRLEGTIKSQRAKIRELEGEIERLRALTKQAA